MEGFTEAIQEIGYQGIEAGDLVIHAMDGFAGAIGVAEDTGKSSPVYAALTPADASVAHPRFFAYVLRNYAVSGFIQSFAQGVRERSTDFRWATAKAVPVPKPDLETQRAIVDYLDHETGEIDAFISDLSEFRRLTAERTAVLITGVYQRVSQLYAHQKKKLAWNARILSGSPVTSSFERNPSGDNPVPVYGGNGVTGYTSKPSRTVRTVVVGRVGAHCGNVHLSPTKVWVTDNALMIDLLSDVYTPEYLAVALENERLNNRADKTAQPLITGGMVSNLRLPAPPHSSQRAVVDEVNGYKINSEKVELDITTAINLAKERRAALISAAVTGQIDVTLRHKPVAEQLEDEVLQKA